MIYTDMDKLKRPNTKGLVSRRFRRSTVMLRIINALTDQLRTQEVNMIDKSNPIRSAKLLTRLQPGEMILRAEIIQDEYVIVTMTPEEFLHYGRILEYTQTTERNKEQ